jgi:hypothetical protein
MIRALALKELREIAGIAAAALLANLVLAAALMGMQPFARLLKSGLTHGIPFVNPDIRPVLSFVAVPLALALGFRQSTWEAAQGTYQFLLHRPILRDAVFLTKLATGVATFLACTALPILLYAWWAATPGHHPSPFAWSMTWPAWQLCVVLPLLYLGAFLSGLRPGLWYGTRLLPLVATVGFAVLLFFGPQVLRVEFPWTTVLPIAVALEALLILSICFVARARDYS